ncbi:uncharacterized protein LOC101850008 [Aplysia californica]|uniref:Uncharacterized protein LOC101850008 n=1 Tax=Aplysia californica TaxID=6500 RepID=A0ABM0JRP0_APLCA|nr:uncharacterized protein LOC101850008 [Aplysia californica]
MPVLTLLALWIVTSVMPRFNTWSSIAIISIGCTFMSLRMRSVMTSDRTSLISALCAFSFVLRNIVVRQLVAAENVSVKPRGSVVIAGVASSCVVIVTAVHFLGSSLWVPPVMCAVLTCGLSVGVFYVSTQLLKSFGVVFVSLFQIWVVLLEALMLTSAKHRPDLVLFATAVILVLLGHYLFFKDHVDNGGASSGSSSFTFSAKPVNIHEQYTRIEFLLFFCSVLGVIFYVFQPKVSQRDLNTLSYVGLDRVIRRLLSIQDDPAVQ